MRGGALILVLAAMTILFSAVLVFGGALRSRFDTQSIEFRRESALCQAESLLERARLALERKQLSVPGKYSADGVKVESKPASQDVVRLEVVVPLLPTTGASKSSQFHRNIRVIWDLAETKGGVGWRRINWSARNESALP